MADTVVTELVIDARGAQAGSALYIQAMKAAQNAVDRTVDSYNKATEAQQRQTAVMVGGATSITRVAQQWERLRNSVDPALAAQVLAQKQLDNAILTADRAVRAKITTDVEAARVTAILRDRVEALGRAQRIAADQAEFAAAQAGRARTDNILGVRTDFNTAARAADIEAYGKALVDARAKYDPLFAAGQRYKEQLTEIRALVAAGALTQAQGNSAIERSKVAVQAQVQALSSAARAGRLMSGEITNLSFQLNDIVTGLALGQSPFMILAQQGGQVYQILANSRTGVSGAIKEIGSLILGLITPTRLAIAGLAGIAAVAYLLYNSWKSVEIQFGNVSDRIGIVIDKLHGLEAAAAGRGIKTEDFLQNISKFGDDVAKAQLGMGTLAELFRANGIEVKDTNDALEKGADLIMNQRTEAGKYRMIRQLGLPDEREWVDLLRGGREGLIDAIKAATSFGNAADREMIAKAREFDLAWNKAWKNFSLGWRQQFADLFNALSNLGDAWTSLMLRLNKGLPTALLKGAFSSGTGIPLGNIGSEFYTATRRPLTGETSGKESVDLEAIKRRIQVENQRITTLGSMATATELVKQKELELQLLAIEPGISFTKEQIATMQRLTRERALGVDSMKQQTDSSFIESATIGMATSAATAYRLEKERLMRARRDGQPLSEANIELIKKEAQAAGDAVQQLERVKVLSQIKFDRATALLSPEDVQIAQQLRGLYGDDVPKALASSEAAAMRFTNAIKTGIDLASQAVSGFANDVANGVKPMDALISAAKRLSDSLMDIGTKALLTQGAGALFGGAIQGGGVAAAGAAGGASLAAGGASAAASILAATTGGSVQLTAGGAGAAATMAGGGVVAGAEMIAGGAGGGALLAAGGTAAALAIYGPLAAIVAILAAIGIAVGTSGNSKKDQLEQNKKAWAEMQDQALAFADKAAGKTKGPVTTAVDDARKEMELLVRAAAAAGDWAAVTRLQGEQNKIIDREIRTFMRSFSALATAMAAGNEEFAKGQGAVQSMSEALKGFITDTETAVKFGYATQNDVATAQAAAQKKALSILTGGDQQSDIAKQMSFLAGAAMQLQVSLVELGMSAQQAAQSIAEGMTEALDKLRTAFTDDLTRKINELSGQGYLNSFADLFKQTGQMRSDASALGLGTGDVDRFFALSAQKIVDESKLTGAAFDELMIKFPALTGLVHEFNGAIARTADELTKARLGIADELFAVVNDTSTVAGQIAALDREFMRRREEELKAGGQLLPDLEKLYQEKRSKIQDEYNKKILERQLSLRDRVFAATNDMSTLEGQIAAFDRKANQERLDEMRAGGEAMIDLDLALAAERTNIIKSFADKAIEEEKRAAKERQDALNSAAKNIVDYLNNLMGGSGSTLSPTATLANAQSAYNANLVLAQGGNIDALNKFTSLADNLEKAARAVYASSAGYQNIRNLIISQGLALPAVATSTDPVVQAIKDSITEMEKVTLNTAATTTAVGVTTSAVGGVTTAVGGTTSAVGGTTTAIGGTTSSVDDVFKALNDPGGVIDRLAGSGGVIDRLSGPGGVTDRLAGSGGVIDKLAGTNGVIAALSGAGGVVDKLAGTNGVISALNGPGGVVDKLSGTGGVIDKMQGVINAITNPGGVIEKMQTVADRIGANDNDGMRGILTLLKAHFDQGAYTSPGVLGGQGGHIIQGVDVNNNMLTALNKIVYNTANTAKNTSTLLEWQFPSAIRKDGAYASGGWISGGIPGRDSVPILAMQNEYMVQESATRALTARYGAGIMDTINAGRLPANVIPFPTHGSYGANDNSTLIARIVQLEKTIERLGDRLVAAELRGAEHVAAAVDASAETVETGLNKVARETRLAGEKAA